MAFERLRDGVLSDGRLSRGGVRRDKHRLVFFDAVDGAVLKLVQRELVLLCFDLGAHEVSLPIIAAWIDRLVHAVIIRDTLNLIVVRVVAEFANASNLRALIFFIFILFVISLYCSFLRTVLGLNFSEYTCTFSRQLIVLLLQEIVILAGQVIINLHVNFLILVVLTLFTHGLLLVLV